MLEAIDNGLFLDAIQRLDKAAQYADIDDESLERLRHPETNRIGAAVASQGTRGFFAEQAR